LRVSRRSPTASWRIAAGPLSSSAGTCSAIPWWRRLAAVPDVYVVVLKVTPDDLERRFTREPDKWFSLEQITAANERFPAIADLLPEGVPCTVVDATSADADEVYEHVRKFLGATG